MIEINEEKICIRNGKLVDFECDIDNCHFFVLVEKEKFLPYIHRMGEGFTIARQIPKEMETKIRNFIDRKNKELRLQNLFESPNFGEPGISTYLKRKLTRDKFDYLRYEFEREMKNKKIKYIDLIEYAEYIVPGIEYVSDITPFYEENLFELTLSPLGRNCLPKFCISFGTEEKALGKLILRVEYLGLCEEKREDTFMIREIKEVRCD
ncbi:hypothetical protein LKM00_26515 [Bacillus wiedmannii]|uniref:hypothetical protein n=1 Tax=Bacillus wiedmannii TaxID=1890302 RepID=UPI001E2DBDE0|nr:hypothetical protein [Bacillus wiedmannii]MCC2380954.1 hypothetical protein [Bacillus wiedmannii]MCC2425368.1 hypothetical protein [Bacillus wiedmannii]